jgi:hypothetical protein
LNLDWCNSENGKRKPDATQITTAFSALIIVSRLALELTGRGHNIKTIQVLDESNSIRAPVE